MWSITQRITFNVLLNVKIFVSAMSEHWVLMTVHRQIGWLLWACQMELELSKLFCKSDNGVYIK